MVEDALVYSYKLHYEPEPVGNTGVVRTNEAVVYVDCYYPRYVLQKSKCGGQGKGKVMEI